MVSALVLAVPAGAPAARTRLRPLRNDLLSALGRATRTGDARGDRQIRLGVAVGHPDPAGEDAYLHSLYDPASPDYHRFLSPAGFAKRFGVKPADAADVRAWAESTGMRAAYSSRARDYLLLRGTIAQAQRLTHTTIGAYRYAGKRFFANDGAPRVPATLPIFSVLGLNSYERFHTMREEGQAVAHHPVHAAAAATPDPGNRTPQQLWKIYQQPAEHTGQGVSVAILGEGATDSVIDDLHKFDTKNGFKQLPVTVVHTPVNGKFDDKSGNPEWNIDMQAVHGMAPDITKEVLYFAPSLADTDLVASTATWVNDPTGPPIMNASLGECEVSPLNPVLNNQALYPINGNENQMATPASQGLSNSSEPAQAMLLKQAVMEGRTFFASSGDAGSSCAALYAPGIGAGNGVLNQGAPLTEDPADQPFAVGVGGTVLYSDSSLPTADRLVEYAWTFSGGNPSPFITAPEYQHGVANLNRNCVSDQNGGSSNAGQLCRGVPDVAAISGDVISNGYTIISDGEDSSGGGTSLSSPLWAGMWARVVGAAPAGSSGYGFANEAIYKIAKDPVKYQRDFFDVTLGSNGLNPAQPGYDYVTGFGTPKLTTLLADVQAVAPAVAGVGTAGVGSTNAGSGAPRCADRKKPRSKFKGKRGVSRKRIALHGTSTDRGCGVHGAGAIRRVTISVVKLTAHGRHCRFMTAKGRLVSRVSCRKRILIPARGHTSWSFTRKVHLPAGLYRIVVRGLDTSGNREGATRKRNVFYRRLR
jgi:pseudomonalisin